MASLDVVRHTGFSDIQSSVPRVVSALSFEKVEKAFANRLVTAMSYCTPYPFYPLSGFFEVSVKPG